MVAVGLDHALLGTAQERFDMQPTQRNSDAELLSTAAARLSDSYSALSAGLHIDADQGILTIMGECPTGVSDAASLKCFARSRACMLLSIT